MGNKSSKSGASANGTSASPSDANASGKSASPTKEQTALQSPTANRNSKLFRVVLTGGILEEKKLNPVFVFSFQIKF